MNRRLATLAAAFALALPGTVLGAANVFTAEELTRILATAPEVRRQAKPADRRDEIRSLLEQPGGDPVTEQRLRELVLSLPDAGDAEQVRLLDTVARREDSIFIWSEDDVHRLHPVVAISPAAAAGWKRQRMQMAMLRQQLAARLQTGRLDATTLRELNAMEVASARELFANAPAGQLATVRDALAAALPGDAGATALAALAAVRLQDAALASRVIEMGEANAAGRALPDLVAALPGAALALLEQALQRDAIAEHAVVAHRSLLDSEPAARERLLGLLDHPTLGPAVAAVLGGRHDASMQLALYERLRDGPPRLARRAALALYLDGSDGARALLARYLADAGDETLAAEVTKWLAH